MPAHDRPPADALGPISAIFFYLAFMCVYCRELLVYVRRDIHEKMRMEWGGGDAAGDNLLIHENTCVVPARCREEGVCEGEMVLVRITKGVGEDGAWREAGDKRVYGADGLAVPPKAFERDGKKDKCLNPQNFR